MNWNGTILSQIAVPALGGLVMVYGIYRLAAVPTPDETSAAHADLESVRQDLEELSHRPLVSATELSAELPETLELATVLKQIHDFADRCDLRAIRFDLETSGQDDGGPVVEEEKEEEVVPMEPFEGGVEDEGDDSIPAGRSATAVSCKLEIESSYEALVRFAGLIEAMHPIARVDKLDVRPGPDLLSTELTVLFHHLPRRGAEKEEGR